LSHSFGLDNGLNRRACNTQRNGREKVDTYEKATLAPEWTWAAAMLSRDIELEKFKLRQLRGYATCAFTLYDDVHTDLKHI